MPISKGIKARVGYSKESHHDFLLRLRTAFQGVFHNPNFPNVPLDMALFKEKIEQYGASITATMGGGKLAFAQRDSLRNKLEGMLSLLSFYVERASNDDWAVFQTAGIEAIPNTYASQEPLEKPVIPKIDHGPYSGQIQVWMPRSRRKIKAYYLRRVPIDDAGAPTEEWTEEPPIVSSLRPTLVTGLKPGTRYAFQLLLLGNLGKTDWSD